MRGLLGGSRGGLSAFLQGFLAGFFEGSGEYSAVACVTAVTCVIPKFVQEMQNIAILLFKCRKYDHIHFLHHTTYFP